MSKNSLLFGIVYGIVTTIAGFYLWRLIFGLLGDEQLDIYYGLASLWDLRTAVLLAIAGNIVFVQIFRSKRFYETMRGIMIVMGVLAICWFIYFRETFMSF